MSRHLHCPFPIQLIILPFQHFLSQPKSEPKGRNHFLFSSPDRNWSDARLGLNTQKLHAILSQQKKWFTPKRTRRLIWRHWTITTHCQGACVFLLCSLLLREEKWTSKRHQSNGVSLQSILSPAEYRNAETRVCSMWLYIAAWCRGRYIYVLPRGVRLGLTGGEEHTRWRHYWNGFL